KARAGKTTAYAGALRPNTPVLVANDARMLPQLFEGVMVTNQDVAGLTLTAAHITKASMRDEDVWTDATDEFGGEFSLAGVDYKIVDGLTAQYYFGQLHNTYKQHFAGLKYAANLGVGKLGADLRYFDTSEDGDGLGRANPRNDNQL